MIGKKLDGKIALQELMDEIEGFDPEMFPPYNDVDKKEKVIATITDQTLRKLFSLSSFYRREGKRLQVDMEASGINASNSAEFVMLKQKHEALQEMFWMLVRQNTDHWATGIGLRKGWTLVTTTDDVQSIIADSGNLPRFLKKIIEDMSE